MLIIKFLSRKFHNHPIKLISIVVLIISVFWGFSIYWRLSPAYEIPRRDSGVFLYIAQQMLTGKLPYVDVWDHKGPILYFINVIGLVIVNGSWWGVWIVQLLTLTLTLYICYILNVRSFGIHIATLVLILVIVALEKLLEGGNFAESYTLCVQFLALLVISFNVSASRKALIKGITLGILLAIVFFLRPNTIGIWLAFSIAIPIYASVNQIWKLGLTQLLGMILGFLIVALPLIFILIVWGIFPAYIDTNFNYNAVYVQNSPLYMRLHSWAYGMYNTLGSGLAIFGIIGWGVILTRIVKQIIVKDENSNISLLELVAVITLPLEWWLSSLSGRVYAHYFLIWLPALTFLTGATFWRYKKFDIISTTITILIFIIALSTYVSQSSIPSPINEINDPVVNYINKYTKPNDYVLMWGAETTYNFLSGRKSPTRYVYQYPLYMPNYASQSMIEEFLGDVRHRCPALIIDTSSTNADIPPLDDSARELWEKQHHYLIIPSMSMVFQYIKSTYSYVVTMENGWKIYQPHLPKCGVS